MAISHGNGEATRSLEEVTHRAAQASAGFTALGIGQADAIALLLRNDIAFFEASLAARTLGAYAVPINWNYKGDEVGYILGDCAAKVLVVHADLLAGIADHLPAGLLVLVVRTPRGVQQAYGLDPAACVPPPSATDWDAWIERLPVWSEPARPLPASMIYTSGTTGRPKGVRRLPTTPEQTVLSLEAIKGVFGFDPTMRTVITGPLYHSAPNFYGLTTVRFGGEIILQPRFDPEELLALIERHRISHLHMVPTMFVRLLRLPEAVRRRHDLSSLRWVTHAAAPCRDCAVFGVPDDEMGEKLLAAIEPLPGADLTAEAVRGFLRERIAGYKVPRLVELHAELPREDSGKIFKQKLRAPFWRSAGRSI